jgi:rare lipoprotein A
MALHRRHLVLAGPAVASALVEAARAEETAEPGKPKTLLQRIIARGQASFYGRGLQGRRTASGERFDRKALTAAHPTLPFGTLVQVENLLTGRKVVVRINDRGPFARGRIIDLSEAAGSMIGLRGVAPVQITPVLAE